MSNDSIGKTFAVAAGLCVVCSVLVSVTATALGPIQKKNAALDKQVNILKAAGLVAGGEKLSTSQVNERFAQVKPVVVDMATGDERNDIDPNSLDLARQFKDPTQSSLLAASEDPAGIKRRPNEMVVYLVENADGAIQSVVLPIRGRGLWSDMYGFLSLKGDLATVANLTFYSHAETPGLGGEISNGAKMAKWTDKQAFDAVGKPVLRYKKGTVLADDPTAQYEVDGISGATLTCNGVNRTLAYWLGENGFGPFLTKLKAASK